MAALNEYQQSFSDFLSEYKFSTFGTFTTKKPLSLPGARRLAVDFARNFDAGRSSSMFWAAEPFDTREGFHFHGLIETHGVYSNKELWNYWSVLKDRGRSQFIPIKREFGKANTIENYCAKYMTKKMSDFDIYVSSRLGQTGTGVPAKPTFIKNFDQYGTG